MTALEVLEKARELLSNKARWTTSFFAKDELENCTDVFDPNAVCWCSLGALAKVSGKEVLATSNSYFAETMLELSAQKYFNTHVVSVNDTLGYEATITMFDKAIEELKAIA